MMVAGLNGAEGGKQNQNPEPRLARAAHQFEAMMMKELLAPMSRTSLEDAEGEETGILGDFATESLAGALSSGGGLGIADRIVHTLSRSGNASQMETVTGKSLFGIGISKGK
jgi:Rod binding domain-containing protein